MTLHFYSSILVCVLTLLFPLQIQAGHAGKMHTSVKKEASLETEKMINSVSYSKKGNKRGKQKAARLKKLFQKLIMKRPAGDTEPLSGVSLGAGILTVLFFVLAQFIDVFGFISILTGLLAIGFGIAALIRLKKNPAKKGKTMAIVGLGLGGLWVLVLGIVLFFFTGG